MQSAPHKIVGHTHPAFLGIFFNLGFDAHIDIHDDSYFLFFTQSSFFLSYRFGVTGEAPLQSGFSAPRVRKVPACYSSDAVLKIERILYSVSSSFSPFCIRNDKSDANYVSGFCCDLKISPQLVGSENGKKITLFDKINRMFSFICYSLFTFIIMDEISL